MAPTGASSESLTATTSKQRWLYSIANIGNTIPSQAVGAFMLSYCTEGNWIITF